jgi:hypothetical protein
MSPSDGTVIRLKPDSTSEGIRLKADTTSESIRLKADSTVDALEQLARRTDLAADDVRAIVSAATKLYARASTQAGRELPPLTADVATTDAITLACALLRSQDLTPFDMAMWFSRGARQE